MRQNIIKTYLHTGQPGKPRRRGRNEEGGYLIIIKYLIFTPPKDSQQ
jgi:hypothetical protein